MAASGEFLLAAWRRRGLSEGSNVAVLFFALVGLSFCLASLPHHGPTIRIGGALSVRSRAVALAWLPLGARLRREEVLHLPIRKRVYSVICDRPGVGYRQLQQAVPVANGTLEFHLAFLERANLVAAVSFRGRTRYYPVGFAIPSLGSRPSPRQERILEYLRRHPGASAAEVEAAMGIGQSTASYHLDALRALGLVTAERAGHSLCWSPTDGAELSNAVPQLA